MENRCHTTVVLMTEDEREVCFEPSGVVATVRYSEFHEEGTIAGVRVVREDPPIAVEGFPDTTHQGHVIVSSQAALAAATLGLKTQAVIYSPGPLTRRPNGEGMRAELLRRWPQWPSSPVREP